MHVTPLEQARGKKAPQAQRIDLSAEPGACYAASSRPAGIVSGGWLALVARLRHAARV